MTEPILSRIDFDRVRLSGVWAQRFEAHLEALGAFVSAASGHPRFQHTKDDCCDRCGAPERSFRAALRLLQYAERE